MRSHEPHPDLFTPPPQPKPLRAPRTYGPRETIEFFDFEAAADLTDWTVREVPDELRIPLLDDGV